jgi:hypothetical protein
MYWTQKEAERSSRNKKNNIRSIFFMNRAENWTIIALSIHFRLASFSKHQAPSPKMGQNKENMDLQDQKREIRITKLIAKKERLRRIHFEQETRLRDLEAAKAQMKIDLQNKRAKYYEEMNRRGGGAK